MEQAAVFVPSAEGGQGQGLCDVSGNLPLLWIEPFHKLVHFPKKDAGVHQFGGTEGPNELAGCEREQQDRPMFFWREQADAIRRVVECPGFSSWPRRVDSEGHGHVLVAASQ